MDAIKIFFVEIARETHITIHETSNLVCVVYLKNEEWRRWMIMKMMMMIIKFLILPN